MPSNAFSNVFSSLIADATELDEAHRELRTGQVGRQWRLGAVNRAAVVMSLSTWEAYVEAIVLEAIQTFRPPGQPSAWQAVLADAKSQIGRFNTPNAENVKRLIADTIGLQDVTLGWIWQNTAPAQARQRLNDAINVRHHVAHGVNPRPIVHNQYSAGLPRFFRQLALATDRTVRAYLVDTLLVANPWPV